jgi:hypothetical protein
MHLKEYLLEGIMSGKWEVEYTDELGDWWADLTGIFAASLGVQPEVRANRPVRPVVLLRSPAVN